MEALLDALAVLLPVDCAGCGAEDRALCADCRAALVPEVSSRLLADGLRVWSGLEYDGVAREVILALKRDGRLDAARALAPALAAAVSLAEERREATGRALAEERREATGRALAEERREATGRALAEERREATGRALAEERREATRLEAPALLVPIPGSRTAYRRRGYDPVRTLMRRAGLHPTRAFAAARPHEAQKTLGVEERERNLRGVFRVRRAVAGSRILLIDDVVTSGATLREAARVLSVAGAEVIGAAVVASTAKRYDVLRTSPVTDP